MVDAAVVGDGAFKSHLGCRTLALRSSPAWILAGVWAWTRPDNVRKVTRVVQRYYLTAPEAWEMFGVGTITGAGSVPVVEDWTDSRLLIEVGGQTVRDEVNPYGWIPVRDLPERTTSA